MRRWSARSTTATSGLAAALLLCGGLAAAAGDGAVSLMDAVAKLGAMPDGQSRSRLRAACGVDALCVARELAARPAGRFVLRRAAPPDSDRIRWAVTRPSLVETRRLPDGRLYLRLDRFGRKAEAELRAAFDAQAGQPTALLLDLRHNRGGDFGRMLRIAAGFAGPLPDALRLVGATGEVSQALPEIPAFGPVCGLTVAVGPVTASSGEVLAALLARHAEAVLVGETTAGKDYLLRVLPLDQGWQLLVPAERIVVPGVTLAGGLTPAVTSLQPAGKACGS